MSKMSKMSMMALRAYYPPKCRSRPQSGGRGIKESRRKGKKAKKPKVNQRAVKRAVRTYSFYAQNGFQYKKVRDAYVDRLSRSNTYEVVLSGYVIPKEMSGDEDLSAWLSDSQNVQQAANEIREKIRDKARNKALSEKAKEWIETDTNAAEESTVAAGDAAARYIQDNGWMQSETRMYKVDLNELFSLNTDKRPGIGIIPTADVMHIVMHLFERSDVRAQREGKGEVHPKFLAYMTAIDDFWSDHSSEVFGGYEERSLTLHAPNTIKAYKFMHVHPRMYSRSVSSFTMRRNMLEIQMNMSNNLVLIDNNEEGMVTPVDPKVCMECFARAIHVVYTSFPFQDTRDLIDWDPRMWTLTQLPVRESDTDGKSTPCEVLVDLDLTTLELE